MTTMPAELPAPPRVAPPALEELVRPAIAGDRAAAERLLAGLLPRVRNLVRYLLRGDQDVDDVAQEALGTIYRRLATYRGDGALLAWADRVTARAAFAFRKRGRARREVPRDDAEDVPRDEPESGPEKYVTRRRLVALLDTIPDEQRDALVMHHVLGLSVPEVAAELSIPTETIRSRLRLGRSRLRAAMGLDGEEE